MIQGEHLYFLKSTHFFHILCKIIFLDNVFHINKGQKDTILQVEPIYFSVQNSKTNINFYVVFVMLQKDYKQGLDN